ncbi:hypothetical protein V2J09_014272 [Rumex salicifolius]
MQRISISSTPSCSTLNSGPDDIESLGDLYVWGELWSDGNSTTDGETNPTPSKIDILIPKPLETDVVLDVHQICCGVRHVALVTRQGEVFTWGEEQGGRLGHGSERDLNQPHIVEFLSVTNVDLVSCGEYHTCAVSTSGDVFCWGDGTYNAGLLGQGSEASHWIPKRVSGPLDGLHVVYIACGTWHSAIVTSSGKLFTFGDGKFGALGHGNRESVSYPKEVQQLSRMKTIKVACGVWHTAAIVEVSSSSGPSSNMSPRKLFTWGDGDKYRLGHGSKDSYLLPTCVSALIDYNFHKIACGYTMTVALTTSGHVFTMGSNSYGQLGNPNVDGKLPCLVQEKLVGEFVEEIACGAYHVAILTSRSEVFTWGKGANGRLGHGDLDDRKSPTLVEALKDRHVKGIACGSSFTSSICIHKWVSGADQSVCCGCRQAFGFTRKRHNCYNCGLVHCHACSSRKALKAALAPTPNKPHRVCDACYNKLKSGGVGSTGLNLTKKVTAPRRSIDVGVRSDKDVVKSARILPSTAMEPVKYLEVKNHKPGAKTDSVSIIRASIVPSSRRIQDIGFPSSLSTFQSSKKVKSIMPPNQLPHIYDYNLRSNAKKSSPPLAPTSLTSRGAIDSLKRSNEVLSEEVSRLQSQIKLIREKYKVKHEQNQNLQQHAKEATEFASEQSSKCIATKDVKNLVTIKLKEMTEKMPLEIRESDVFKAMKNEVESFLEENDDTQVSYYHPNQQDHIFEANTNKSEASNFPQISESSEITAHDDHLVDHSHPPETPETSESAFQDTTKTPTFDGIESESSHGTHTNTRPPKYTTHKTDKPTEIIEQIEPGVYVTVIQLKSGAKVFKRVRFSKRKFLEQQAEEWWKENKERVMKKYSSPQPSNQTRGNIPVEDQTSAPPSNEEEANS